MEQTPWDEFLSSQSSHTYYQKLSAFIKEERKTKEVYPPTNLVLHCFKLCLYYDLKVVMIGDEPLCDGNDMGLAFSSLSGVPISQQHIRTEIENDLYANFGKYNKPFPGWKTSNLAQWSTQGILLMNSVLTVAKNSPNSHKGVGWETFTIEVVRWLSAGHPHKLVFMLWGSNVERYSKFIDDKKHLVLKAPNVIGSKHFSQTNEYLLKTRKTTIGWHTLN